MRKNSTYEEKRKAGFTLVELIVVLVMLSILTAVAVPTYMGYVDDNKAKQCETHRKALASRLEEMSAMGSTASLTDDEMNSAENGCPAGGKYTLEGSGNTIHCDKHGDTTVILKSTAGIVTADVNNVQTEAPKETATPTPTPTPTPAPTPTLNLSITPNPVPTMEIGTTNQLTADPGSPKYCTVNDYEWRSDNSDIVSVGSNGKTVTITAVDKGTCTIYCKAKATASAEAGGQSFDSAEVGVQVTVNEKKELSVTVSPKQISMEPEERDTLEANVTATGYTSYTYAWSIGDNSVVSADGASDQNKFAVKGLQGGSTTVTCTVRADDGTTASDSANILVQSTVSLPDEVLIPGSWNRGNTTTNGTPVTLTSLKGVHVPSGGFWSCDDSRVTVGDNGYVVIADDGKGDSYTFTYETQDGQIMELHTRIVYQATGMFTTQDGFEMELGDHKSFRVAYQPDYITDGPIEWSCTDENVIQFTPGGEDVNTKGVKMNNDITVTAVDVGEVTLTAKICNEYQSWLQGKAVWDNPNPLTWKIKVNYKSIKGMTANQLVLQKGGEPKPIEISFVPNEGIDTSGLTYKYEGYDSRFISVSENGVVTPLEEGSTTIWITVSRDGTRVTGGSCNVVVTGDPNKLTAIGFSPERIDLIQGQTARIVTDGTAQDGDISVYPIPSGASLDGSTYTFRSDRSDIATVDSEGVITASTSNTGEIPIYVEAKKDNKGYVGTLQVNVLPDPNKLTGIHIEPTSIRIAEGQQARIVPASSEGDAEIKIFPEPGGASLEGATYTYQSYNSGVVSVSDDGVLTAGSNVVGQTAQIHVTVKKDDKEYSGDIYVTVDSDPMKLVGINLKPDTITIMEGQQATISTDPNSGSDTVIYPLPTTASLEGVEFSYSVSDSSISVSQDGVITGESMTYSKQQVTVTATKGDQSFTGHVYVNVTKDPDRLSDFWIDPVSVQEGSTATVVKHLTPEEPDLTDVVFAYRSEDSSVATVSPDGVVTGHKAGSTKVWASASKNGKALVSDKEFSVTVFSIPTKFTVAEKEYGITSWEILKEYIQKKQSGAPVDDLPTPAFFLDYSAENKWNVYVLRRDADLKWDDSFSEATSFNEFYKMNTEAFGWVANNDWSNSASDFPTNFSDWGDQWYNCNAGTLIRRNGKIYIAVDSVPNGPLKSWTEEFFTSHFAEMVSLN